MLWVDKYRPTRLDAVDYHRDLSARLSELAKQNDLPHLLFYGPSGSGKRTRVTAFLREVYGAGADKLRLEHRVFKGGSNKNIEITTIASNYHIEVNPSDAGNNDRFVIQEIIREIASSNPLHAGEGSRPFKVVVLTDVDRLTRQAQASLRRTMEKYSAVCRLILISDAESKIISPLKSRCLSIRIGAPTTEEICQVIHHVSDREGIPCDDVWALRIATSCNRNLRQAIICMQTSIGKSEPELPDWRIYISKVSTEILQDQSPQQVLKIRQMLYELIGNCIPSDIVIETISNDVCRVMDDDVKLKVMELAVEYDYRCKAGSHEIVHLEAFVVGVMMLYKSWLLSWNG